MARKIYVGNLNYSTVEDSVREMFAPYGEVVSLRMITDRETGRFRGFAFVEMETEDAAEAAINALNGQELDGRKLVVNEAMERRPSPARGDRRY